MSILPTSWISSMRAAEDETEWTNVSFWSGVTLLAARFTTFVIAAIVAYAMRKFFGYLKWFIVKWVFVIRGVEAPEKEKKFRNDANSAIYLLSTDGVKRSAIPAELTDHKARVNWWAMERQNLLTLIYAVELASTISVLIVFFHMIGIRISVTYLLSISVLGMIFSSGGFILGTLSGIFMIYSGVFKEGHIVKYDDEYLKVVGVTLSHTYMQKRLNADEENKLFSSVCGIRDSRYGYHNTLDRMNESAFAIHRFEGGSATTNVFSYDEDPSEPYDGEKRRLRLSETKIVPNASLYSKVISLITCDAVDSQV